MDKRIVSGILLILLAASFLVPLLQVSSSDAETTSHIIVHVHNPEGVEIGSIGGMSSSSVEIYDGDALIGYGACNSETYNKPMSISPGIHTIKAKFNGLTLEQNVDLQPNETRTLVFSFNRTEFDLLSWISSQFNCHFVSQIDGTYSGLQEYVDDSKTLGSWATHAAHENIHADTYGTYSLCAELVFSLLNDTVQWRMKASAEKTNSFYGNPHPCYSRWHASCYMPMNYVQLELSLQGYANWFLQYSNCSIQSDLLIKVGNVDLTGEACQIETLTPGEISVGIQNIRVPDLQATGLTCNVEQYPNTNTWHHWGDFEENGTGKISVKLSSVPYDLAGTGVKDKDNAPAYIIVHALNPEGTEIASIEGMDPNCVEIYDSDSLIGYGAHNNESYNNSIAISPGAHTIKVRFNGMELTQNVDLQEGRTNTVRFVFSRTSFDLGSCVYDCDLHSFISGSWSGKTPRIDDTERCNNTNWWTEAHFEEPADCGRYGSYVGEAKLQFSLLGTNYSWYDYAFYSISQYDGHDCPPETPKWASETEPDSGFYGIPSQNPDFNNWFLQYTVEGKVEFFVGGILLSGSNILLINTGSDSTLRVIIGEHFQVWGDSRSTKEDGGNGIFDTKMSSVPYDLTCTGIRDNPPPIASFTYTPEKPLPGEEIAFDASSSYSLGGELVNYGWAFGDGNSAQGEMMTHVYPESGEYAVILTVTDSNGETDIISESVKVLTPVILVHGWHGSPATWSTLISRLNTEGINYSIFNYSPATGDPRLYAENLSQWIDKLRVDMSYSGKFDIVCHSMGALVSRWYMEKLGGAQNIRQWIGICPVNHGAALADMKDWWYISWLKLFFPNLFNEEAVNQMKTTSLTVTGLEQTSISPNVIYRVIVGTNTDPDHRFLTPAGGKTLAKCDCSRTKPYYLTYYGDGVVAMKQSLLDGAGIDIFPGCDHNTAPHDSNVINLVVEYLLDPSKQSGFSSANLPLGYIQDPDHDRATGTGNRGILLKGEYKTIEFPVDSSISEATVIVGWPGSELNLTLTSPSGEEINSNLSPAVQCWKTDISMGYVIDSPEPGLWTARIDTVIVPEEGENYTFMTMYSSNLVLELGTKEARSSYNSGENVSIVASLTNGNRSIAGASVTAEIERPNGTSDMLTLYDDGSHGDTLANDGNYTNSYFLPESGTFNVVASAQGDTSGTFERTASMTLWAEQSTVTEFPSILIIPLFMMATLLAVLVHRRKHFASEQKSLPRIKRT